MLTPGPWLHVGADEAYETPEEDYVAFARWVQGVVTGLDRPCSAGTSPPAPGQDPVVAW